VFVSKPFTDYSAALVVGSLSTLPVAMAKSQIKRPN
jgi:hypothetical protein